MKTTFLLPSFALLSVALTSCFSEPTDDLDPSPAAGQQSTVRILTRADGGEALQYPLHVYGFSDEGTLIAHQQLASAQDQLQLTLPKAQATHLVALSAGEGHYQLPDPVILTSAISMTTPEPQVGGIQGYALGTPLQLGSADLFPQSDNATVSIQLHYQVASLSVAITGLPQECTSVHLSVASTYSGLSFGGQGIGTQTARIPLSASTTTAGEWSATDVYVFPTTGNTTFTLAYNDADGEQYSSVTYLAPLTAGTPYQLQGAFADDNFQLTGSISPSHWAEPVQLAFNFSPSSSTTITPQGGDPSASTGSIPQLLTTYNGHLVAGYLDAEGNPQSSSSSSSSSSSLLLLSLTDWGTLTSALNENTPTMATDLATAYTEFDLLTGWRIPTEAEARYLSKLYRDNPDLFPQALSQAQADPIVLTDDRGNNLRYLCQDAQKTYGFNSTSVTNAGATVKTYHLRLVRTLPIASE